jgi:N-acetylmuramic acid 6-phosphate etherase
MGSSLAALADVAAEFDVGAEAVEGSTRLAAGTAQKAALGVISTLACAELGHVHDGLMVNVHPDNAKLRGRARGIVARIARVDGEVAASALEAAGGHVKTAIVAAAGSLDVSSARALLDDCSGELAEVLARLDAREGRSTRARA